MSKKTLGAVFKEVVTPLLYISPSAKTGSLIGGCFSCLFTLSAFALDTAQIDELTQQWLNIEKQSVQLQRDWQEQQPILEQQLTLLNEEKSQLTRMLSEDTSSQAQVDVKRSELLQQQGDLEQQQDKLTTQLNAFNKQLLQLNDMLPPPLINAWQSEDDVLDAEPTASLQLQVGLAKLAKLNEFDQRISVYEMPLTAPNTADNKQILVKQFYLGVSQAWFTSANGEYRGWGQATPEGWQWHFDENLDQDKINKAIAIFEKKKQADFVSLPMVLQAQPFGAKQNETQNQGAK
ncbi:DUF3450 family protein [Colwellia sp. E2M01]|uniref:DUF3450 family protein n=1 Tax=Colwellia sp. E2M01 TaxID=2841561 RepID=UPI001C0A0F8D|nr:DUF3450 family protein [Colwellia sp. E2M01]MBU2871691.1 DUF3450 domain-containing protein [Colwellia sp. E2M01]